MAAGTALLKCRVPTDSIAPAHRGAGIRFGSRGDITGASLHAASRTRLAPRAGTFGQFILVLPAIDTVIVHRRAVTDEYAVARNLGKTRFEPPRVLGPHFLKLADIVVAAKAA